MLELWRDTSATLTINYYPIEVLVYSPTCFFNYSLIIYLIILTVVGPKNGSKGKWTNASLDGRRGILGWKRVVYRRGKGQIVEFVKEEKRGYDAILFKYNAEGNREEIINKVRGVGWEDERFVNDF